MRISTPPTVAPTRRSLSKQAGRWVQSLRAGADIGTLLNKQTEVLNVTRPPCPSQGMGLMFIHEPPTCPVRQPSRAVVGSGPNIYLNKKLTSQPSHCRCCCRVLLPAQEARPGGERRRP